MRERETETERDTQRETETERDTERETEREREIPSCLLTNQLKMIFAVNIFSTFSFLFFSLFLTM